MQLKTKLQYLSIADHFLKRLGDKVTPKRITDELKNAATEYRPDYWRRLRIGLALQQEELGYQESADRIRALVNPVTADETRRSAVPGKQRRVKRISEADEARLLIHLMSKKDTEVVSAVLLACYLGVRPAEMPMIKVEGDRVYVAGVKKRGDRGLDRLICITDPSQLEQIRTAQIWLSGRNMKPIQNRLSRYCQALWPARKYRPSLYSWRHQMGTKLKQSGRDRRSIAYLMGHQSTDSVNRYGNRSSKAGGLPLAIEPADDADMSQIRENHTNEPRKPAPVPRSSGPRLS